VRIDREAAQLIDADSGTVHRCEPIPAHLLALVEAGGLVPWLERHLAAQREPRRNPTE
jgi:3-isopropylmalate/(R)-2-methylmalate dehydratase small subunit